MKIRYLPLFPSRSASLWRKFVALLVALALLGLALMFAAVLVPVILLGVAWFWWKTRAVRRQFRQMQQQMQQMQEAAARAEPQAFRGEVYEGEIIEAEVVRVSDRSR